MISQWQMSLYIAECKRSASTAEIRKTNLSSKTVEWTYQLGHSFFVPSLSAHANGSLYVAAQSGYIHRINTSNATDYYKRLVPLGKGLDVDAEGNVYSCGYDSGYKIVSLNLSGSIRWTYLSSVETSSIAVSKDGKFLYSTSAVTGYVGDDGLEKLNAVTGTLLKAIRPAGRKFGLITSPNGDVFMSHKDSTVPTPVCLRETFKILN
ncbi:YncE family protein [Brevibacillus brevis]|uniref:YncE family protein n=1 Tax=Brevibacillus brevis TaxID=1393 RepID=UPI0019028FA9|nr:PQQ-like beta-propeller repeat protein [Brevibacillus brevis]